MYAFVRRRNSCVFLVEKYLIKMKKMRVLRIGLLEIKKMTGWLFDLLHRTFTYILDQ